MATFACSGPEDRTGTPVPGGECEEEGERQGDYLCDNDEWVVDESDAGVDDADPSDADCDPESHPEFCTRHEVDCGSHTAEDNCGALRTVHCSEFDGFGCQPPAECDANECRCPELDDGADADEICDTAGADCGLLDPGDVCDEWGDHDEVDCGECPGDDECGTHLDNVCGCPCLIDDTCYADGQTAPDGECLVCDPDEDNENFTELEDGTDCGADGVCDGGDCICPEETDECGGACVDLDTDPDHCGECDSGCDDGQACNGGQCVEGCPGGETDCDGNCVDLDENRSHCGECDNECSTDVDGASPVCDDGECTARCVDDDETLCSGECIDVSDDETNCGTCGNECTSDVMGAEAVCDDGECVEQCAGGEDIIVCDGFCTDTRYDSDHCGECDNECNPGQFCSDGECTTMGGSDQCDDDDDCGDFMQCCDGECQMNTLACPDDE